jgi:serine phosphatase RsbU (regulator of sigma subunit)
VLDTIDRVLPTPVKILIAILALLALGFAIHSRVVAARARRLARQREELLGDVGLLQRALLPEVPDQLKGIDVSVAYRPAEGPAAGGDFYDVFELEGGRTAIIVGDVCGHGRAALAVTALMRYTLRAYMGVGFEPRVALQVAARALEGTPDSALTTVVLAIYDPSAGTLTYACAGHEPPIVLGRAEYDPVTAFSAPPLGGFMPTGQRQTTVSLPKGSSVCFFTDGLVEARLGDQMIGRQRLSDLLSELEPDCGAQLLLERLAASADRAPDDMAACLVRVREGESSGPYTRIEELEADADELRGDRVPEFLAACGVSAEIAVDTLRAARAKASEFGGALLRVTVGDGAARVEVSPKETAKLPVPSIDAVRRQAGLEVPAAR